MKEFGPRARKWAVSLHVGFASLWFGSAFAMVLVMWLRPAAPASEGELLAWCLAIKLIDDMVIIGSAAGSLLTGLLLSWKTKWGFFIWFWVAFKLLATVCMVVFGATCLGPWIDETAALVRCDGLDALAGPSYVAATSLASICGSLQVALLAFILGVSIFKPWGKIRGAVRGG
jgi:hypothetical protein